ncbi:hypothetical protein [Hymenobacter sp. PAMC 26628]|uniref:hypothetical protein n=1 Tax=Hymenobacter sp. PAMC 26628 TaxID=1484118 RepID=UPI0007700CF3|nr:hypothetical protein [Hymenobacter sp. PAMC 26628]AMJ65955.1 hypothetical protein AXW84_11320 [Hymenobacter sp. PAMC 26628]
MVNIIVVADDLDDIIGENCRLSYGHLSQEIGSADLNLQLITGENCHSDAVVDAIIAFDQQPFVFVGYSHGNKSALISTVAQNGYVSVNNAHHFGTSLFYTTSCSSAVELKGKLIEANCFAYVGYDDKVIVPENEQDQQLFITCENTALVHFLNSDDTLAESVEVMRQRHWAQYNEFLNRDEYVTASLLMQNLDCLAWEDTGSLRRSQLAVN